MTMRVYNVSDFKLTAVLEGHEGEISKAVFNPQGTKILSASFDHTARLWNAESGELLQTL
jgi:dynein assembly factor with WDR repeat domains 1